MIIKKRRNVEEINSSSMADIAFLLLIFFLVTTTIDPGEGLTLTLPPIDAEQKNFAEDIIVEIRVSSSGSVLFDKDPIEIKQIQNKAKEKLLELGKSIDPITGEPKIPIFIIMTAEKAPYQLFLDVLDQLKLAECKKISVIT